MGIEIRPANSDSEIGSAPVVVGLQPFALVDHIAKVDWSLLSQIPGERGGSFPVLLLSLCLLVFFF